MSRTESGRQHKEELAWQLFVGFGCAFFMADQQACLIIWMLVAGSSGAFAVTVPAEGRFRQSPGKGCSCCWA